MNTIEKLRKEGVREDLPEFKSGDTVKVHTKLKEGDKERIQIYEGLVIRRKGHGKEATFTVRKMSYGVGVERIFPVHSPMIDKVELASRSKVRRSKLYYLRNLSGRKARLQTLDLRQKGSDSATDNTGGDSPAPEQATA